MERCQFVAEQLSRKALPVYWSNEELSKLGYSLKTYIQAETKRRLWYRFRADWFQGRDFMMNLQALEWQPHLDKTNPRFSEELHRFFESTVQAIRAFNRERGPL